MRAVTPAGRGAQLEATTKKTIAENEQMASELSFQVRARPRGGHHFHPPCFVDP
jgi:hypothetical protein